MNENICRNCKHWGITDDLAKRAIEDDFLIPYSAECKTVRRSLDFIVQAGWEGGVVTVVETEHDFGCIKFERRIIQA